MRIKFFTCLALVLGLTVTGTTLAITGFNQTPSKASCCPDGACCPNGPCCR